MKKFRFKLEGLMKIRKQVAEEIHQQLIKAQGLCEEKIEAVKLADQRIREWSQHYNSILAGAGSTMDLAGIDRHIQKLYRHRGEQILALEILERKRLDILEQYQLARRNLEAVEHLKDKRLSEYRDEERREDARTIDEIATIRKARERMAV